MAEEQGIFLTNQNGVQTTQFESGDSIYVEGICEPSAGATINDEAISKVFIASDKTWQTNDDLSDISGGIETIRVSYDAKIPRTKIWGPLKEGAYDVLIDTNSDFVLQAYEQQCVIGLTDTGFRVGNPVPVLSSPPPASTPPPPPVSAPTPSVSSVDSEPSAVLSLDEYVEVKSVSDVRKSPGGILVGTQNKGALGIVVGGPAKASLGGKKYWFWNINFAGGSDG